MKPKMEENKKDFNNFQPREYQIELFEKAIKRNTIIFLPTGSGKTYIASMLIKHKSKDIERKYSKGGKRTFFLVNTVSLVQQQAESIARQLPFKVGRYSGDMGVDYWDQQKWLKELEEHEILVMTAQIFLDMLRHLYIALPRVNLIVMDECHHAVNKHAMRQIMELFEGVPMENRPHILGLTATLLNGNIKPERISSEIHKLEVTLHAKIARAKNEEMIQSFSTNPMEEIMYYDLEEKDDCCLIIDKHITQINAYLNAVDLSTEEEEIPTPIEGVQLFREKKSEVKKIKNMLSEIQVCAKDLGGYAANYALLSRLITLERLKLSCFNSNLFKICSMIITDIHKMRKELHLLMSHVDEKDQPFVFSSSKVKKLFKILNNFSNNATALVFVTRRITAKVLFYVFDDVVKYSDHYYGIRPDFIVGHNSNLYNDTRETLLERRKNMETLKRFNSKETNLLFASDVVEEGIDVQHCNIVIKFDNPNTLCSYIQSKGRARHKDSKYVIFAPIDPSRPFERTYSQYKDAEKRLTDELSHGKDEQRPGGTQEEAEMFLYSKEIEPFQPLGPNGPVITLTSAVSLLNRYCCILPQDKFTKLTITYWKKNCEKLDKVQVFLQLPMNCPLREIVESEPCHNLLLAKASAALNACKKLYYLGEFNGNLLPIGSKIDVKDDFICPLWEDKDEEGGEGRPGSKKRRRAFDKKFPRWICECTPVPYQPTYLHLIKITPNYKPIETNRHLMFYNLLKSPCNFAILTSKKWPKVCEFAMFMNVGEVTVKLCENVQTITFTDIQLKEIFDFHCLLFTEALAMKKKFLVKDYDNGENSYYIVPVLEKSGNILVDWDTIQRHKSIPEPKEVLPENRGDIVVTKNKYHGKIVIPWYRPNGYMLKYVVTKVCEDETPLSPFPSDNFESYVHYFSARYNQQIVNIRQPLLEVRAISSKNNCLLPRGKSRQGKRRRRDEDDLEETLIPELCTLLQFPSVYMLKVTLLPSVMHRITLLLLAEELRQKIASQVQLGSISLPKDFVWSPLIVDQSAVNTIEEHPIQQRSTIEVSNMLADKMESLNPRDCPWDRDEEPCDIERNIKSVDLLSIIHYDKFVTKPLNSHENENIPSSFGIPVTLRRNQLLCSSKDTVVVPKISLIEDNCFNPIGPEQGEVLQALISSTANDVVNYERLETLGDSYLKFMASVILFIYLPNKDEGKLTYLKGKIIGNRNLFYCGRNIDLGSIIKVNDFAADDWDVPHYSLLSSIKTIIKDTKLSPGLLYQVTLSQQERESGLLSDKTLLTLMELFCKQDNEENNRTSLGIIGQQSVPDKVIADSVEALIGVYLKEFGIKGAMKLCKWLKIVSDEWSDIEKVFSEPPLTALLSPLANVNDLLIKPDMLEAALGYKFKDRSFLLQALTHSTFSHNITDCYQRLEFLGDAILDFLITSHIYNTCGNLSPGDLTDLRSALVNNVTFACLTVRNGFHKFVLVKACKLTEIVNKFVFHQERRNHQIGVEVLFLVDEEDVQIGEIIDVPKMLGDVFESLAGAVYLDSGKSLKTVWEVFYRLMHKEIEEFSRDVPKNNVRILYEKFPSPPPSFGKAKICEDRGIMVTLHVTHNGEIKAFHGIGENKNKAKLAAAKVALRYFHNNGHK